VAGQTAAPAGQTAANAASAAGTTPESAERASNESQVVQPGAAVAEPSRRLSVTAGFDFLTAYLFRGIYQEDHGLIMPPFVDVGISVYEGEGALKNVTINAGNWNSLHSGSSGHSGFGNAWYEADYYGSVSFAIGKWTPGALFTSYTSPNSAFNAVHEIAAVLAYDDSDSAFPLSPSVDARLRAARAGRRRRTARHVPRAGHRPGADARRCAAVPPHALDAGDARHEPPQLLRGADRQQPLRLLRRRRGGERPAGLHERQDHMGGPWGHQRGVARRQPPAVQRRRPREAGRDRRD
jgi:hypothetical protein